MNQSTFCPIPWLFQAVRNNGDIRICCQANVTKNQGVIRHSDGTPYNASRDSLEDARNADLMKSVRQNMLENKWSSECGRCKQEEESGLNSRRQYEQQNWPRFTLDKAIEQTDTDGNIALDNIPVNYYDLRFGNMCNLACRMCGPTDSHTWYEQWIDYHNSDGYDDTHGRVTLKKNKKGRLFTNDYDWHGGEVFWNSIENNIPNIQHVYMAGGEPMMIARHYEFLQKCIDSGYAKKIIIEYNTNMTNLPDRVLEMWKKFKQVRVGASIDGFGPMVEYQRWPLKWDQAYKNLKKLDEVCKQNWNIFAWLACTVTAYNVFHIPEFMWWKLKESNFKKINSSRKRPIITHHVAHGPKRTNIKLLPLNLKKDLVLHYNGWKEKFQYDNELSSDVKDNAIKILDSITNFANSEDYSDNYLQEFINWTNYLDKTRKQSILDVVPQYKKLFV